MRTFDAALSLYWAIQEESLRTIFQVLARENLSVQDALAIREARGRRFDGALSVMGAHERRLDDALPMMAGRERRFDDALLIPEAVEVQAGQPLEGTRRVVVREGVAIIKVIGPIVRRAGLFSEISGAASIETLARDFNAVLESDAVDAIVFYFDSPGGEVNGINEFAQMIYDARGRKPMTAYVGGMCASGAYWLATACDEIICDQTAVMGSIGVIAGFIDTTDADAKAGLKEIQIVSSQSPKKRLKPDSQEGRKQIQETVDALADVFVAAVARNRGVSEKKVLTDFGEGGVMVGAAAVGAGLADRLGSFERGLTELASASALPLLAAKHGKSKRAIGSTVAAMASEYQQPGGAAGQGDDTMERKGFFKSLLGMFSSDDRKEIKAVLDEENAAASEASSAASKARATTSESRAATSESRTTTQRSRPSPSASEAEIERLRADAAELIRVREQQRIDAALAFATAEVHACRAMPAETKMIAALMAQAALDDELAPLAESIKVVISAENAEETVTHASRVDALRAMFAARPRHGLTVEQLPAGATVLPADQPDRESGDRPVSSERRAELLKHTPAGQAALQAVK